MLFILICLADLLIFHFLSSFSMIYICVGNHGSLFIFVLVIYRIRIRRLLSLGIHRLGIFGLRMKLLLFLPVLQLNHLALFSFI